MNIVLIAAVALVLLRQGQRSPARGGVLVQPKPKPVVVKPKPQPAPVHSDPMAALVHVPPKPVLHMRPPHEATTQWISNGWARAGMGVNRHNGPVFQPIDG